MASTALQSSTSNAAETEDRWSRFFVWVCVWGVLGDVCTTAYNVHELHHGEATGWLRWAFGAWGLTGGLVALVVVRLVVIGSAFVFATQQRSRSWQVIGFGFLTGAAMVSVWIVFHNLIAAGVTQ